jgi:hypothetical protein
LKSDGPVNDPGLHLRVRPPREAHAGASDQGHKPPARH